MLTTDSPARRRVAAAVGLVLVGSTGIQLSAAISSRLFDSLGPLTVSAWRMAIGAVVLLAVMRPTLRRSRAEWVGIVVYGVAMAAMNLSLYEAVDRLPLGFAVTLDFLGPCAVALLASRRIVEAALALVALAGVVLIAGPAGYGDVAGIAFGLSAGFFFALYTVFSARVGKAEGGISGLALSVTVAALVSAPFAATGRALPDAHQWWILAVAAVLGVALTFTVDTVAARLTSARVVGTLFSVDPLVGALVGLLVLGQALHGWAVVGIVLVAVAGASMIWTAERPTPDPAEAERPAAAPSAT